MSQQEKKNKCNHGHNGDCCCNCKYQVKIMCHPNNLEVSRGKVDDQFSWGCIALLEINIPEVTTFSTPHGICEMHIDRPHSYGIIGG